MTLPFTDYPDWQSPLAQAQLVKVANATNIGGGGSANLTGIDMRNYESYQLMIDALGPNPATNFNPMDVVISFTEDVAHTMCVYSEHYSWFSQPAGGAVFLTPGGRLHYMDAVRGPFLKVSISNRGPDSVGVTTNLYGSSRMSANRLIRETNTLTVADNTNSVDLIDSLGLVTLAAAASVRYVSRLHMGRTWLRLAANTTDHTFQLLDTFTNQKEIYTVVAGTVQRAEMIWPDRAMRVTVTNIGGVNGQHRINVIGQKDPQ